MYHTVTSPHTKPFRYLSSELRCYSRLDVTRYSTATADTADSADTALCYSRRAGTMCGHRYSSSDAVLQQIQQCYSRYSKDTAVIQQVIQQIYQM